MSNLHRGKWEKRWHPLREEWVVYSAHRNNRPWSFDLKKRQQDSPAYDPTCYLCPGNARHGGHRNPDYDDVFVFDNDFPVVGMESPEILPEEKSVHGGLYRRAPARGVARVVCYAREHNASLATVSPARMTRVFEVWQNEMIRFERHPDIHSVLIFENRGEIVGVSNPHPHCQIYAVDFPLQLIEKEALAAKKYKRRCGRNLFDDIVIAELADRSRIVAENEHAVAFVPFFARYAYEVLVFPKKRHPTLITLSPDELRSLAAAYQEVVQRFDELFKQPFPYVMNIHQASVDGKKHPDYCLYVHFQPPLRQPGLPKYLAGPEIGAGNFMADTMPEEKAAELRATKA
jgi:UDPglucose--hexose-1-phosphate uridylyltransferase